MSEAPPPSGSDRDDKDDEDIPRLPRGRGFKLPMAQVMSILMLITCLIAVLALREGCAKGVANFFNNFDQAPPARDAATGNTPPAPR